MTEPRMREIRSFVRREGRMTPSQKRALEELWPKFGFEKGDAFARAAPLVMEIGFGNGEHLLARAQAEPDRNFLGVEVHRPGAGRVMNRAQAAGLANLRVSCEDAVEVLRDWLPERCLAELVVYFPDPWHKKRHHKRRLVSASFAALAASRLAPGGVLKLATDWADYARQMREVLDAEPLLSGGVVPRPAERPLTRFENRGLKLGHEVFDLVYRRKSVGKRE